jgi:hypothetical protein
MLLSATTLIVLVGTLAKLPSPPILLPLTLFDTIPPQYSSFQLSVLAFPDLYYSPRNRDEIPYDLIRSSLNREAAELSVILFIMSNNPDNPIT